MKVVIIAASVVVGYLVLRQVLLIMQRRRERPLARALGGRLRNSTFPIGGIDLLSPFPRGSNRICKIYWNENGIIYFRVNAKDQFSVIRKEAITGIGFDITYRVLAVCAEGNAVFGWQFGTRAAVGAAAKMVNALSDDYPISADDALKRLNRVRGPLIQ